MNFTPSFRNLTSHVASSSKSPGCQRWCIGSPSDSGWLYWLSWALLRCIERPLIEVNDLEQGIQVT